MINIKKITIIVLTLIFIINSFSMQVHAGGEGSTKEVDLGDGESKTVVKKEGQSIVGNFVANLGDAINNMIGGKNKEDITPADPKKGSQDTKTNKTDGKKDSADTNNAVDVPDGYKLTYITGLGYAYAKVERALENGGPRWYNIVNSKGNSIGKAIFEPGKGYVHPILIEPPKPVITTKSSTTKGDPYTKNIKTVEYHWTIKNTSIENSATEKAKTPTFSYARVFPEVGTYIITATPYCLYKEGREDKIITETYTDGKLTKRKTEYKNIELRRFYDLDTKNKSSFQLIVTTADIGKKITVPPPGQDEKVEVYYELVE